MSDIWNNKKKDEIMLIKQIVDLIMQFKLRYLQNIAVDNDLSNISEFTTIIETTFPDFISNYTTLYHMIMTTNDLQLLYSMIDSIIDVCDGVKTIDTVKTEVSNELTAKYLKPTFGEPPKS